MVCVLHSWSSDHFGIRILIIFNMKQQSKQWNADKCIMDVSILCTGSFSKVVLSQGAVNKVFLGLFQAILHIAP